MNPEVLNRYKDYIPADAVYIGRGSKWGNVFGTTSESKAEFLVQSREEAIHMHRWSILEMINEDSGYLDMIRRELKGKNLVCFCKPKSCHGDILLELAND